MSRRCPSALELEEYLAEPVRSRRWRHISRCGPCRAELARMRLEGERFDRTVRPETVDAVHRALQDC